MDFDIFNKQMNLLGFFLNLPNIVILAHSDPFTYLWYGISGSMNCSGTTLSKSGMITDPWLTRSTKYGVWSSFSTPSYLKYNGKMLGKTPFVKFCQVDALTINVIFTNCSGSPWLQGLFLQCRYLRY